MALMVGGVKHFLLQKVKVNMGEHCSMFSARALVEFYRSYLLRANTCSQTSDEHVDPHRVASKLIVCICTFEFMNGVDVSMLDQIACNLHRAGV